MDQKLSNLNYQNTYSTHLEHIALIIRRTVSFFLLRTPKISPPHSKNICCAEENFTDLF